LANRPPFSHDLPKQANLFKVTMKMYKYYFLNLEKPISVEANNKQSARNVLEQICNQTEYKNNGYEMLNLVRETSETLVAGVSFKTSKQHGVLIWSDRGWVKKIN